MAFPAIHQFITLVFLLQIFCKICCTERSIFRHEHLLRINDIPRFFRDQISIHGWCCIHHILLLLLAFSGTDHYAHRTVIWLICRRTENKSFCWSLVFLIVFIFFCTLCFCRLLRRFIICRDPVDLFLSECIHRLIIDNIIVGGIGNRWPVFINFFRFSVDFKQLILPELLVRIRLEFSIILIDIGRKHCHCHNDSRYNQQYAKYDQQQSPLFFLLWCVLWCDIAGFKIIKDLVQLIYI